MAEDPSTPAANPTSESGQGESQIQLGPDLGIYPDAVKPSPEPATPTQNLDAPAPAETEASESPPPDAGPGSTEVVQQTRRQRGEDLYQRGLREGREQL